jgi:hypothetical protein
MADHIYAADGRPQGFRLDDNIHDLDGTPLGRVWAEKVYTFGGTYVGAIFNNMVVDRPNVSRRRLPAVPVPARAAPRQGAEARRPIGIPYADCFNLLVPYGSDEAAALGDAVEADA